MNIFYVKLSVLYLWPGISRWHLKTFRGVDISGDMLKRRASPSNKHWWRSDGYMNRQYNVGVRRGRRSGDIIYCSLLPHSLKNRGQFGSACYLNQKYRDLWICVIYHGLLVTGICIDNISCSKVQWMMSGWLGRGRGGRANNARVTICWLLGGQWTDISTLSRGSFSEGSVKIRNCCPISDNGCHVGRRLNAEVWYW